MFEFMEIMDLYSKLTPLCQIFVTSPLFNRLPLEGIADVVCRHCFAFAKLG